MRVNYTFRHRNWSNYLVDYANKKANKLKKYEKNQEFKVNVTFLDERNERVVTTQVDCDGLVYIAKAVTDDYFEAIDQCFNKVAKQMQKNQTKTKSTKMQRQRSKKARASFRKQAAGGGQQAA